VAQDATGGNQLKLLSSQDSTGEGSTSKLTLCLWWQGLEGPLPSSSRWASLQVAYDMEVVFFHYESSPQEVGIMKLRSTGSFPVTPLPLRVVPGPAASASSGNGAPPPDPLSQEVLGVGPSDLFSQTLQIVLIHALV
jgi:hypothetical protein